jgi:4-hydroxybenzoate polyprenyltransferase
MLAVTVSARIGTVRMLRLREWYYFLALPLAGIDPSLGTCRNVAAIVRGVAIAFFILGFGYLVNAAGDAGSDSDARKNPLLDRSGARWTPPSTWALVGALAIAATGLAAAGPSVALAATLVSLVSGAVYSIGPRLKAVPIAGTLANATNFVPLLWVGAAGDDPSLARRLAPAFAGVLLQSQIVHEAADAACDARAGVRTTFIALGRRRSAVLAALFGALPGLGPPLSALFERAVPAWSSGSALFERAAPSWSSGSSFDLVVSAGLLVTYGLVFPLVLARLAGDPARAATLRLWHRWSGVAVGAALFLHEV